jgi:SAM-dependent methyltransferase
VYRARFPDDWVRYEYASRHVAGRRVLDCACGAGYGSWVLARSGASQVVGVDVSQDAIDWGRTHFALGNLDYRKSDGQSLPLDAESVDQVVSLETIEHVPDARGFVRELARVLVPGGGLVLSTPLTYGSARLHPHNRYHLREYDDVELEALLQDEFEIVQRAGQQSSGAARFAALKRTPGVGPILRAGVQRLLPTGLRIRAHRWLSRDAGGVPPAWISIDDWRNSPVQIVVARKRAPPAR